MHSDIRFVFNNVKMLNGLRFSVSFCRDSLVTRITYGQDIFQEHLASCMK